MTAANKDPNLHPAAQELLDDAHVLGWSIHQHVAGRRAHTYRIVSPINGSISIEIPPVRQWNQDKLRSLQDKLLRYSDPDKVEALQARKERARQEREDQAREVREKEAQTLADAEPVATVTSIPVPKPSPPKGRPALQYEKEPTIVETKPWLVRHGMRDGLARVYDSHAVIQRTWSDGRVDFACVKGDFVNENPWSVGTHYSRSKEETHPSRATMPEFRLIPPEEYTPYTPVLTKQPFTRKPNGEQVTEEVSAVVGDPAETLALIVELVAPDLINETNRLQVEVAELRELLTTAEQERDAAEAARNAAEAKADRANTALRNFKAALAGLDDD